MRYVCGSLRSPRAVAYSARRYGASALSCTCQQQGHVFVFRMKNYNDVEGAVNSELTLSSVQTTDAGVYRCRAASTAGKSQSMEATLIVSGKRHTR